MSIFHHIVEIEYHCKSVNKCGLGCTSNQLPNTFFMLGGFFGDPFVADMVGLRELGMDRGQATLCQSTSQWKLLHSSRASLKISPCDLPVGDFISFPKP